MEDLISKKDFLNEFCKGVQKYKPLIEKKISKIIGEPFNLGNLTVSDSLKCPILILKKTKKDIEKLLSLKKETKKKYDNSTLSFKRRFIGQTISTLETIIFPLILFCEEAHEYIRFLKGGDAAYFGSIIYLNTSKRNLRDQNITSRKFELERTIMHELSHALQDRLLKKHNKNELCNEYKEAFAHYCESNFFYDLYEEEPTIMDLRWGGGLKPNIGGYFLNYPKEFMNIFKFYSFIESEIEEKGEKRLLDIAIGNI